jgi:hypothetical protein
MAKGVETTMQADTTFDLQAWRSKGAEIVARGRAAESQREESRRIRDLARWELGDWLIGGKEHLGKNLYDEAASATGLSKGTLYNIASVAREFPISRRREDLDFSHYAVVASVLGDDNQDRLLEYGSKNDLSVRDMQRRINYEEYLAIKARTLSKKEQYAKTCGITLEELERREKERPKRIAVWLDPKSAKAIRVIARAHKKQPGDVLADWACAYYTANLDAIKAEVKELEAKLKLERQQKRQQETAEKPKRVDISEVEISVDSHVAV